MVGVFRYSIWWTYKQKWWCIEFDGTDDSISIDFSQLGTLSDMTLEIVKTYGGVALSSQECLIETDDGRDNGFGVFLEYGGKDFAWLDNKQSIRHFDS